MPSYPSRRAHRAPRPTFRFPNVTGTPTIPRPSRTKLPWYVNGGFSGLPDEGIASNDRTVTSLLRSSQNGDLPSLFADTLNSNKYRGKAEPEFGDFLHRLHRRDPDRAKGFEREVMEKATPDGTRNLRSFITRLRGGTESATRHQTSRPQPSTPHPAGRRTTADGMAKVRQSTEEAPTGQAMQTGRGGLMRRTFDNMTDHNVPDERKPISLLDPRNHPRSRHTDAIPPAPRKPEGAIMDAELLPSVYSKDFEKNQQAFEKMDAMLHDDPQRYSKLSPDAQAFHQGVLKRLGMLDTLNPEQDDEMQGRNRQIALQQGRESLAARHQGSEIGKNLMLDTADVVSGIEALAGGSGEVRKIADYIRGIAFEGIPKGMEDTQAAAAAKGMAEGIKLVGGMAPHLKAPALIAGVLGSANDSAERVLSEGGTKAQAAEAARASASLHAILSQGGGKAVKKFFSTLAPDLAKTGLLPVIVEEVGSKLGEQGAEELSGMYEAWIQRN